jgi:hypothetical protein
MEKTISLEQREQQEFAALEMERKDVLAQVGALMLDLEQAKVMLGAVQEKHRGFIQTTLRNRGVTNYSRAQMVGGSILCSMPDEPMGIQMAPPAKPNGGAAAHDAE